MGDVKVRRRWTIDPVEKVHSQRKKPKKYDIPAGEDIMDQLKEMEEDLDYIIEHGQSNLPNIDYLRIKK